MDNTSRSFRKRNCAFLFLFYIVVILAPRAGPEGVLSEPGPVERREYLLELFDEKSADAAAEFFAGALKDNSELVRRTAAHLLIRLGEGGVKGLEKAISGEDSVVARIAVEGMVDIGMSGRLVGLYEEMPLFARRAAIRSIATRDYISSGDIGFLQRAAGDKEEEVRNLAFRTTFGKAKPGSLLAGKFYAAAARDDSLEVREMGFIARWEREPDSEFPEREREIIKRSALPSSNWKFRRDRERIGHLEGWHEKEFEDEGWRNVEIEKAWHNFLGEHYVGVGWYRREIEAPDLNRGEVITLHFGGVDEMCWVWLNGVYAGRHNIGPAGWDVPFDLEVSNYVKTREINRIAVRVKNTARAGGIWRPVEFRTKKIVE